MFKFIVVTFPQYFFFLFSNSPVVLSLEKTSGLPHFSVIYV